MTKNVVLAALDPRNEPEPPEAEPAESQTTPQADWEYIPSRRPKVVMDRGAILIKNGRTVPIGESVAGPRGRNGKPMFRSIGRKRLGRKPGPSLARNGPELLYWREWLINHRELGLTQANLGRAMHGYFSGKPAPMNEKDYAKAIRHYFKGGGWPRFQQTGELPSD